MRYFFKFTRLRDAKEGDFHDLYVNRCVLNRASVTQVQQIMSNALKTLKFSNTYV